MLTRTTSYGREPPEADGRHLGTAIWTLSVAQGSAVMVRALDLSVIPVIYFDCPVLAGADVQRWCGVAISTNDRTNDRRWAGRRLIKFGQALPLPATALRHRLPTQSPPLYRSLRGSLQILKYYETLLDN